MGTEQAQAAGTRTTDDSPAISTRKALIAVVGAVLLAGGVFTVIGGAADFGKLEKAANHALNGWLAICLLGQLLSYVGYILAYRDAARATGGPHLNLKIVAQVVIFGSGASLLGASVGGLAVDYWALRRTGAQAHSAARRVLALGTMEWTVLALYAWVSALLVLIVGAQAPLGMVVGWLVAVPLAVIGARWFTSPRRAKRYTDPPPPPEPCGDKTTPERWIVRAREHVQAAFGDAIAGVILVRHLVSHPGRYKGGAFGYPIYWAADMLTLYAALRALGFAPQVLPLILAYCTSYVISALPLPAGGAGGIEAAIALALHSTGVPLAPALLAAFIYRIFTFWLPIIPALLLLPHVRNLQDELPSIPHSRPDSDETIDFRRKEDLEAEAATAT